MTVKAVLLAVAGVPALVSNAPVPQLKHPYIHQMVCAYGRGTAFQINSNTALSVNHVTAIGGCMIDGKPVEVVESDPVGDFSIIRYRFARPGGMKLSCGGFKDGELYMATGYAKGLPVQRTVAARYNAGIPKLRSWFTLLTPVPYIPGQSGGPVQSARTGEVVGLVNAYSPQLPNSFSRSLSETSLCKR